MTTYISLESDFTELISKKYHSINVVSADLPDTKILEFSDEFFASAENLISTAPPIQKPNVFTEQGAWYDGWETRRHNEADFDFVIIRSGVKAGAKIAGCEVDTTFFTGNNGEYFEVEGAFVDNYDFDELKKIEWNIVVAKTQLKPNQRHFFLNNMGLTEKSYNIFKFKMFPDGGITRFRLYGRVDRETLAIHSKESKDWAYMLNGGVVIAASNQHYSSPSNLLLPGRGINMGDGWETKRSRTLGHTDWVIVKLGKSLSVIEQIIVDTANFKGNFPNYFEVYAISSNDPDDDQLLDAEWIKIVTKTKGKPHQEHILNVDIKSEKKFTHVKLVIIPDGGVKRLRVIGH
ncbi:hypothetical protein QEN19_002652 [Hanseniaspora menglaensis]